MAVRFVVALVLLLATSTAVTLAAQTDAGSVSGRVTDTSGVGLSATVRLVPPRLTTPTSRDGSFRFDRLATGSYTLRVSALGYAPDSAPLVVTSGQTAALTLRLKPAPILLSAVAVSAQRLGETKAAALDRQQSAVNLVTTLSGDEIRALPNANAAEAAGRIPGVSIERDEGEGKFVQIRGTEPRLSNVTINGSHVPGTEGGDRIPKLDDVPSDVLAAIEVNRTLAANMDADAIGGSVNLVTKTPEGPPRGYVAGQFGHITLLDHTTGQGGAAYGGRFGQGGRLGVLLGGSIDRNNRVINDVEPSWAVDAGGRSYPVEWSERDYLYYRTRYGLGGDLDYRFNDRSSVFLKGMWSEFLNHGTRYVYDVASGGDSAATGGIGYGTGVEVAREASQRRPTEQMWGFTAGGRHALSGFALDYSLNYAGTRKSVRDYRSSPFDYTGATPLTIRYDGTNPEDPQYRYADPAQTAAVFAPSNYTLSKFRTSDGLTTGRDLGGSVNATLPYRWGDRAAAFTLGVRVRDEAKVFTSRETSFDATGTLTMDQVLGSFSDPNYYSAITRAFEPFGPVPGDVATHAWEDANPGSFSNSTDSVGNALASFSGSEKIYAGYLMNDVDLGRLHVNLGLRVERTRSAYVGHVASTPTDTTGNPTGPTTVATVSGSQSYTDVFPSAQLRYTAAENTNIRVAVTRAIARPNYSDLAPSLSGNLGVTYQNDYSNLSAGNPDLRPQHAWNFDVLVEHFLPSVGVISAGVFYKRISDFILTRRFVYNGPYAPFDGYYGTRPENGGGGHLVGFELDWAQHLTFLPGALAGFGFDANYTHVTSSVAVDTVGRTAPLLRQAPDLANLALTYERGRLSSRVAWTYNGANIASYSDGSATAGGDTYFYAHSQIDGSVILNLTPWAQLQAQVLNLNNAVFGFFNGTPNHAFNIQREYYGRTYYVGMKYGF